MKYLTINTVLQSFMECRNKTQNKFWGLVSILSTLGVKVVPATSYSFSVERVQTLLEQLFRLEDDKKTYSSTTTWSIMFSNQWIDTVPNILMDSKPNIYHVAAWYYRRNSFDDDVTEGQIIDDFLAVLNITRQEATKWFSFSQIQYSFSTGLYKDSKLLTLISNKINTPTNGYLTLSFEEQAFIRSNPGSLGQAPFIQTLYANQKIQQCLILTQFDFQLFYPISNNILSPQSSSGKPLQKIYYGTPGSGKSFKVKNDVLQGVDEKYIFRTTFHPDSDYASFVGCYKPRMEGDEIRYDYLPQAFTNAYVKAWQESESEKEIYLVIEEINRGNCAQIFGDLFQLLDRKEGVSEYPINADADLRQYLENVLGTANEGIANGKLKLPANLNIIATMNTSDQSLFPMDSAFKRRWTWEYVPIDYNNIESSKFKIRIGGQEYSWNEFLKEVNKRIFDTTDSEDKQMGNFFINADVNERQFIDKVMFYLWNDICKEEYHTSKNFFRRKTEDNADENTEFSFNSLFEPGNSTKYLMEFMEYLGISPVNSSQSVPQSTADNV